MTRLILTLFTILTYFSAQSQKGLGVKFGANLSKMEGQFDYYQTKNQVGFQGGVSYSHQLIENLNIRPEFLITQKGGKIDYTLEASGAEWKLKGVQRINFLEIPLNLDVIIPINEINNIVFAFGFYWAVGIGGTLDLENDFTDFDNPRFTRVINYNMPMQFKDVVTYDDQSGLGSFEEEYGFIKKHDFGARVGIGWQFSKIMVDLTYVLGFSDMNPHEQGVISDEIEKNTRNIQFNITYFLPDLSN